MKRLILPTLAAALGLVSIHADLSPADQAVVEKKLDALKRGDFPAPGVIGAPPPRDKTSDVEGIRKVLGEAEAKISGRELRAICSLAGYLADQPQAPDRDSVHAQIEALDAASKSRIEGLLRSYEEEVLALPTEKRDEALRQVARLWSQMREDDQALRVINSMQSDGPKSDALSSLVEAQTTRPEIQFGGISIADARTRLEASKKLAESVPLENSRSYPLYHVACGYLAIARRQIREGDFDGAGKAMLIAEDLDETLAKMSNEEWWSETEGAISTTDISWARAQVRKGDLRGARLTLVGARKRIPPGPRPIERYVSLMDLADAETVADDPVEARELLLLAIPLTSIYNDRGHSESDIVRAQVKAGDIPAAKQTAAMITTLPDAKYYAWRAIGEAQMKAGDLAGARDSLRRACEAVENWPDPFQKNQGFWNLAADEMLAGDRSAALAIVDNIPDPDTKANALTQLAKKPGEWKPEERTFAFDQMRPSERYTGAFIIDGNQWDGLLASLAHPWFTAYPDFSRYMEMAAQIEKTPVGNGLQPAYRPDDKMYALNMVANVMTEAQGSVDGMLWMKFPPKAVSAGP